MSTCPKCGGDDPSCSRCGGGRRSRWPTWDLYEPPETYAQWDLGPPFHGTEDERAEYLARVASAEGVPLETIIRRWRWVQAAAISGVQWGMR